MKTIEILCNVPIKSALAAGRSDYGETKVRLGDADIASLTPAARQVVASLRDDGRVLVGDGGYVQTIDVDVADAAHVVAAIEALIITSAAEERARRERAIADALSTPSRWLSTGHASASEGIARRPYISIPNVYPASEDPRLTEYKATLERDVLPGLVSAWSAECDRLRGERAAEEAQAAVEARAAVECVAALRELAKGEDDLARAATEDYPVTQAMLDRLGERVRDALAAWNAALDKNVWTATPEDRPAPSPDAFAMLDRCQATARAANETLPRAVGQWEVSRILRLDVCPHKGTRHLVTAVLVTLDTPIGVRQVTVSTEPQSCTHDDDDEYDR